MQCWVEGALFQPKDFSRGFLNMQCDPVTMHPPAGGKRFQHQQIESPLKAIVGVLAHRSPIASYGNRMPSGLVRCQVSATVPGLVASVSLLAVARPTVGHGISVVVPTFEE